MYALLQIHLFMTKGNYVKKDGFIFIFLSVNGLTFAIGRHFFFSFIFNARNKPIKKIFYFENVFFYVVIFGAI